MLTPDAVQERSYLIWEREGRPHGRDVDFWLLAEAELRAERAGAIVELDIVALNRKVSEATAAPVAKKRAAAPRKRAKIAAAE